MSFLLFIAKTESKTKNHNGINLWEGVGSNIFVTWNLIVQET
jgi:hypothetical protein